MSEVTIDNSEIHTRISSLSPITITVFLAIAFLIAVSVLYIAFQPLKFEGATINSANYAPGYVQESVVSEKGPQLFTPVSLPFSPDIQDATAQTGTYLLQFKNPTYIEPVVVFHSIQDSAKVWLNDVLINEIGEIDVQPSHIPPRNRHNPNLIRLPPELLKDNNRLELHVRSKWEAALGPVTIAEHKDVKTDLSWHQFWRVNFLWVGISFAVPMALFFLSVWFFHRQSSEYLWLGIVMAVWPFNTFPMTFTNTALNEKITTLLQEPSNLLYATALVSFTFVYRGTYEWAIRYIWKITAIIYILFSLYILFPWLPLPAGLGLGVLYGWIACVSLFSSWVILANVYERRNIRSLLMAMSGIIVETIAIWDMLPLLGVVDGEPLTYIVQWGVITVLICYSSVMSYELALALQKSDQYNNELTREVDKQTSRLKKQYNDIIYLEKQQVMSDERSRLISDMHDGTSGQIVSIIAGLKSGKLSNEQSVQQLQYCLQDLRLILDSMNAHATDDLASALGLFRQRVDPLLVGAGLKTHWKTAYISDEIRCSPKVLLNIFRVMQEALTNVIKHANASEVKVFAEEVDGRISLHVIDDGVGLQKGSIHNGGYGYASMKKRAFDIGGTLSLENHVSSGVEMRLQLNND